MIPISILDLAPIRQNSNAKEAFRTMRAQAQFADELGYHRYWLAEHHNMGGIGSAATSVLIGHIAEVTQTMRVGSGGIMLPNHAPLVIAEQFGTLESLYPGRIELGLGRAPGTDQLTARALRRDRVGSDHQFPQDVLELQAYFREPEPGQVLRAVPGAGLKVPIWLLGSSLFSAQLAAHLGLPYAFASHFAPDMLTDALHVYRTTFQPSEQLDKPYVMVGVNVVAADSDEEARWLFSSQQLQSIAMMRGRRDQLAPPVDDIETCWTGMEKPAVEHKLSYSVVGDIGTLERGITGLIEETNADELICTCRIYDPGACHRSLEILAAVGERMAKESEGFTTN